MSIKKKKILTLKRILLFQRIQVTSLKVTSNSNAAQAAESSQLDVRNNIFSSNVMTQKPKHFWRESGKLKQMTDGNTKAALSSRPFPPALPPSEHTSPMMSVWDPASQHCWGEELPCAPALWGNSCRGSVREKLFLKPSVSLARLWDRMNELTERRRWCLSLSKQSLPGWLLQHWRVGPPQPSLSSDLKERSHR